MGLSSSIRVLIVDVIVFRRACPDQNANVCMFLANWMPIEQGTGATDCPHSCGLFCTIRRRIPTGCAGQGKRDEEERMQSDDPNNVNFEASDFET
jgi:hypothetical protein